MLRLIIAGLGEVSFKNPQGSNIKAISKITQKGNLFLCFQSDL